MTTPSREQFDAWHTANMGNVAVMEDIMIHRRWKIWQAAYAAGQEAMRERLTRHTAPMTARGEYRRGFLDAIAALRALEIER